MWLFSPMGLLRPLASLLLGMAIFVAFPVFLIANSLAGQLLNANFYSQTLAQQDAYNRIYDEVLLDPVARQGVLGLLGKVNIAQDDDIIHLLRMIMPSDYLQEQVEGALARSTDYFKGDADTLALYIDLGLPLRRVKPVLLEHLDQRIDALKEDAAAPPACTPERIGEVTSRIGHLLQRLSQGSLPQSIPALKALGEPCRSAVFEALFHDLMIDRSLDQRAAQGLRERRQGLRDAFLAADSHRLVKQAAHALAILLIDDAIAEVRKGLDGQDRLDIVAAIADWQGQLTAEELRDAINSIRDGLHGFPFFRQPVLALVLVAGGSVLMGLVHLSNLPGALRWPGLTLMLTGGVWYAAAKVAQASLPSRLEGLLAGGTSLPPVIPQSAIDLGMDILQSLSQQIFSGLAGPSLVLTVLGVLLFASSFGIAMLRPFLPPLK